MFLVFSVLNDGAEDTTPRDTYTVDDLPTLDAAVKELQAKFVSAKEVAEEFKGRLTLNLINSVAKCWRFSRITIGGHNIFFYKTQYVNDPEYNLYFFRYTLFDFISQYCADELSIGQLAFYTERSPVAFWSKKYDAIPENLRSRWFIEKNPRKRFFRSKYFDELMHYLSLRTQKRKQEYANAIALAHPKTDDETAKIQEANRKLQAKLDDISSKKFALEERLNKVNEQYNNISRRIALNNAKIK
jgi:hypothetical protein